VTGKREEKKGATFELRRSPPPLCVPDVQQRSRGVAYPRGMNSTPTTEREERRMGGTSRLRGVVGNHQRRADSKFFKGAPAVLSRAVICRDQVLGSTRGGGERKKKFSAVRGGEMAECMNVPRDDSMETQRQGVPASLVEKHESRREKFNDRREKGASNSGPISPLLLPRARGIAGVLVGSWRRRITVERRIGREIGEFGAVFHRGELL